VEVLAEAGVEAEEMVEEAEVSVDEVVDVVVVVVDSLILDHQNSSKNWDSSHTPVRTTWCASAPLTTFPTSTPRSSWKTSNRLARSTRSSEHSKTTTCR